MLEKLPLTTIVVRKIAYVCAEAIYETHPKSVKKCFLCLPMVDYTRSLHAGVARNKAEDRKEMLASLPAKDEGTDGEKAVDIDYIIKSRENMFPDEKTPDLLFGGIPFKDLPICNIRASPNNTIFTITDHRGVVRFTRSCGVEGFKNTRKGTNIAAQATAISLSMMALESGYKTVRVRVRGLGPGRMTLLQQILSLLPCDLPTAYAKKFFFLKN